MTLRLVTGPATMPITLAEAKTHLRVDSTDEDALITAMIASATEHAETFTGRRLIDQTLDYVAEGFPRSGMKIRLPLAPVISVEGVFYSKDGAETEMDAGAYVVELIGGTIQATTWPAADSIRVRFRVGYVDAQSSPPGEVPGDIVAAIKLTVGHLYQNRESVATGVAVAELPLGIEALLRPKRFDLSMA